MRISKLTKNKKPQKANEKKKLSKYERKMKILQIYRTIGHTNITKISLAKELGINRSTLKSDLESIKDEITKIPAPEINFEFDVIKEYINAQARKIADNSKTEATKVKALKLILEAAEKSIKVRQMLGIIDQPTQKHKIQASDFSEFYDEYFSEIKKFDKD